MAAHNQQLFLEGIFQVPSQLESLNTSIFSFSSKQQLASAVALLTPWLPSSQSSQACPVCSSCSPPAPCVTHHHPTDQAQLTLIQGGDGASQEQRALSAPGVYPQSTAQLSATAGGTQLRLEHLPSKNHHGENRDISPKAAAGAT